MIRNEFAGSRILVVGRNAATTVEIERGLMAHGHEVVGIATSCSRALELAEIHEPELVLVDDAADCDEVDLTVMRLRQRFRMPCIRVRPPRASARLKADTAAAA
jgi:AmiR/NasT family two-component response regulator